MSDDNLPPDEIEKVTIRFGSDMGESSLILPLVKQAHKESFFSNYPFDETQYQNMCSLVLNKPGYYGGLYVEYDGEPIAFAFFLFRPGLGSRKTWVTMMHSIYIRADFRATPLGGYIWKKILVAVQAWSTPRGSKGMVFNVSSGIAIQETDLVLRASGAAFLGGNYFLRI